MPKLQSKPCRKGETITVWVRTKSGKERKLEFDIPILIEQPLGLDADFDINVFVDNSGSFNVHEITDDLERFQLQVRQKLDIFYPSDERWIKWLGDGISRFRPTVSFALIDETSEYEDDVPTEDYGDYGGGGSDSDLYGKSLEDLIYFKNQYEFGQISYGHLMMVGNDTYLRRHVISAFQKPELQVASHDYAGYQYSDNFAQEMFDLLNRKNLGYFVKIWTLQPNFIREYLEDRTTTPFNELIPDPLFERKLFEIKDEKPIDVEISCGGKCPPGYCEIATTAYPYFCCIKA